MREFDHYNALSVDEAVSLLVRHKGKARINAGGTDLLSILKDDILPTYPGAIVNIKAIPGLDYIGEEGETVMLGALCRLSDIARSPLVNGKYAVLAQAARAVGSPQIRNVATIGGNLCQDVRCWYFRYPESIGGRVMCARKGSGPCLAVKGDNRYHAIMNGRKCFAVCPSDTAVALTALDGAILIIGPKGERTVAADAFFNPMGNALAADEMVCAVKVPVRKAAGQQAFLKFTLRTPIDFAIVSVAVVLALDEGVCRDARIVLGAVGPAPVRAYEAERMLIGRPIDGQIASKAGEAALAGAKPLSKNAYKVQIARTLVKRAILNDPA
jgi:xanthine dehydrogenase YagS FAD-binding subunit